MTNFIKPVDRANEQQQKLGNQKWQSSSRIQSLLTGSSKSIGASCNVYQAQDSINSIADGHKWAYHVLAYQGAPSVDFSNLRPRNSQLGTGGKSSGAVSFIKPFDSIVSTMRREEKKNGAGIAYLSYSHADLDDFLALDTQAAYKGVYLPMHGTPEADAFVNNKALVDKLAKAYNEFRCFLVKRPLPVNGEPLLVNLCTEIEIPHKGFCVLGAINLSQFTLDNLHKLPSVFVSASLQMLEYAKAAQEAAKGTALECNSPANFQFGLGVYGLASLLANIGVTYEELADELEFAFCNESSNVSINDLASIYFSLRKDANPEEKLVKYLLQAYNEAELALDGTGVRAAFCIQPTVSTAQRSFDASGYHASPEIQPVIGLRYDDAVSTIIKSAIKGDKQIDYHPTIETIDDVPYETYAKVSALWQRIMDSTGLAHRHSHCFYGQEFTSADLVGFMQLPIKSLYYRLPYQVNTAAMDKSQLWQDIQEGELVDFDVDALLYGGQVPGAIECSCTM
jgi:hypothetical protein